MSHEVKADSQAFKELSTALSGDGRWLTRVKQVLCRYEGESFYPDLRAKAVAGLVAHGESGESV